MTNNILAIGVMSGTSLDGIDISVVELTTEGKFVKTVSSQFTPFSEKFKKHLQNLTESEEIKKELLIRTDRLFGDLTAELINKLLSTQSLNKSKIKIIGSHGLTIGHFPEKKQIFDRETSFTMQIGDGDVIASKTGIPVISDFRRKDMAENGEGAPLIPIIDKMLFADENKNICCLNIGGISNITIIPALKNKPILAFDTGPGNCLTDKAISILHHEKLNYDPEGQYAKMGKISKQLFKRISDNNYFKKLPPKSTGKEYFGNNFLDFILNSGRNMPFKDIFTTISYLTPFTIAMAIKEFVDFSSFPEDIIVSGGGAKNTFFLKTLRKELPNCNIDLSDNYGISSDFKEAIGFAMLGYMNLIKVKGSIPEVTGANKSKILGKLSIPE